MGRVSVGRNERAELHWAQIQWNPSKKRLLESAVKITGKVTEKLYRLINSTHISSEDETSVMFEVAYNIQCSFLC